MSHRLKGELCESAKKGHCCIDDICHGSDITLCGFDKYFYEQEVRLDAEDDDCEDGCLHGVPFCDVCEDCDEEEALEGELYI